MTVKFTLGMAEIVSEDILYTDHLIDALHAISKLDVDRVSLAIKRCRGTIWLFGNGGSFANALHWSCDLQKASGMRTGVLGSNGSLLTAFSNDVSYDDAVAEEFSIVHKPEDLLIIFSCSGCSSNIVRLLVRARELSIPSVLLTGSFNAEVVQADITIKVDSKNYGIIEDCHAAIGHWLTNYATHDK